MAHEILPEDTAESLQPVFSSLASTVAPEDEKKPNRFAFWRNFSAFRHPATTKTLDALAKLVPLTNGTRKLERLIDLKNEALGFFKKSEIWATAPAGLGALVGGLALGAAFNLAFSAGLLGGGRADPASVESLFTAAKITLEVGLASVGVMAVAIKRMMFVERVENKALGVIANEVKKTLAAEPALEKTLSPAYATKLKDLFEKAIEYPAKYDKALGEKVAEEVKKLQQQKLAARNALKKELGEI